MTQRDDVANEGRVFNVSISYFHDGPVWLATSDDIQGLTVEADSFQTFLEALIDVSAELLADNHGLTEAEIESATLHVKNILVMDELAQQECAPQPRRPSPKLMLDDPIGLAAAAA